MPLLLSLNRVCSSLWHKILFILFAICISHFLLAVTVMANALNDGNPSATLEGQTTITLRQESLTVGEQSRLLFGLEFHLGKNEKVQAPSTSSNQSPPQLDTSGSTNVSHIEVHWPTPTVVKDHGYTMQVYASDFIVPFELVLKNPGEAVRLKLHLRYIQCGNQQCTPAEKNFLITIPAGTLRLDSQAVILRQKIHQNPNTDIPSSLFLIVALAFLGGVVLNFMPCVLPVLGLKFLGIISSKTSHQPKVGYLFTILGILVSFWLMAFFVLLFKQFGHSIGWGMHFQQPLFLGAMIAIMLIFSLNLLDVFQIVLPLRLHNLIQKATPYAEKHQWLNGFSSGIFATLLATPCSAPFLGVSVGFVLVHDLSSIFLVFTGIGLGFSFPYWILILIPGKYLPHPRPGPWMQWIKRILALLLLGTAAWLSTVLYYNLQRPKEAEISSYWKEFSSENLAQTLQNGKSVLVFISAKWCLTCHMNEVFLDSSSLLKNLISSGQLVALKGDWTRQDSKISEFLASFGRSGIPFIVLFTPETPKGIILPELLSAESLKKALKKLYL